MSTYTKQDCLNKINDISTNLQSCFTAIRAKGVTVAADSSLDDLPTLIRAIPDASHPDIALPWIMSDGSSAFWLPRTMTKGRSFYLSAELTPVSENTCLIGAAGTSDTNSNIQLLYNSTSLASYRRLTKTDYTGDTMNFVSRTNLNPIYPYYQKRTYGGSYVVSTYQAAVNIDSSWSTAPSSMSQLSNSVAFAAPIGLLAQTYFSDTGLTFPRNICPAGVKIYDVSLGTSPYTSAPTEQFTPYLHWDSSNNIYRPCFRTVSNGNYDYSSFPKTGKNDFNDGNAYYIDVTQGLSEINSWSNVTAANYNIGIPVSTDDVYVFEIYENNTANPAVPLFNNYDYHDTRARIQFLYEASNSEFNYYQRLIYRPSWSIFNDTVFVKKDSDSTYTLCNYLFSVPMSSTNSSKAIAIDLTTASKTPVSINIGTYPSSLEGYLALHTYNGYGIKNFRVYKNGILTNYLSLCDAGGTQVFYDCITKTIIRPE